MANAFYGDRFVIDTAGATLLGHALAPGLTGPTGLKVKGLRWVGATTASHTAVIQDTEDAPLWASVASGANYVESDLMERRWLKDFKVVTLGSGVVYVYLDTGPF